MKKTLIKDHPMGLVPFVNGTMVGDFTPTNYFRALNADSGELDIKARVEWQIPYEFEGPVEIESLRPPLVRSLGDGIQYVTTLDQLLSIFQQQGAKVGGFLSGRWRIDNDPSAKWYLKCISVEGVKDA